jgi:hypothetical protein
MPAIWPAYSIYAGHFDKWLYGVYEQTHREGWPLSISINEFFRIDPILLIVGIVGLFCAALKRDFFLLLWAIPFIVFMYLIGFVSNFHLLPLISLFCISAARLIVYIMDKLSSKIAGKKIFPYTVVISGLVIFGLTNTIILITANDNSPYFKAAAFVNRYVPDTNNNNSEGVNNRITVTSSPFYIWIQKYRLHLNNYMHWAGLEGTVFKSKQVLWIADNEFNIAMKTDNYTAIVFNKLHNLYYTKNLATFEGKNPNINSATIILNDLQNSARPAKIDLLSESYTWKSSRHAKIQLANPGLSIMANTINTSREFNRAILQEHVSLAQDAPLLSLNYGSKVISGNGTFSIQLRDINNHESWSKFLDNTFGKERSSLFLLPDYLMGKTVELRLNILTTKPRTQVLFVKKPDIN